MNGKGDTPRPASVNPDEWARRFAETFPDARTSPPRGMNTPSLDEAHGTEARRPDA